MTTVQDKGSEIHPIKGGRDGGRRESQNQHEKRVVGVS